MNDKGVFPGILPVVVAAVAAVASVSSARGQRALGFPRDRHATCAAVVTLFVSLYPRVMVSDPTSATA